MGMYTELVLGVDLRSDTPNEVVDTLTYMLAIDQEDLTPIIPDHELFQTDRWEVMLRCGSSYFDGGTHSEMSYDKYGRVWRISIRCNLKNYSSEIEKFINWISPYVSTRGFAGYSRYEEEREPTLIYF